jgi:hypothetical protein
MEEKQKTILGKNAIRNLEILRKSGLLRSFYLAGGTGAALSLLHRRSRDFDFFSQKPFNEHALVRKLSRLGKFELERKTSGTVIGFLNGSRVSFFYYPYRLLKPRKKILGVNVANSIDIACMKLDAISSRGSKRDFIDLYWIMRQESLTLQTLLELFKKKYSGTNYNLLHIKKGLIYFADAEHEPMPVMQKKTSWREVKNFFEDAVRGLN